MDATAEGAGHVGYALRERSADVVSLRHVFQPDSVAVVGASRRMGTTESGHRVSGRGTRRGRPDPARADRAAGPISAGTGLIPRP
jgi:hypothetical protein